MAFPAQLNWCELDFQCLISKLFEQELLLPGDVLEVPIIRIEWRSEPLLLPLLQAAGMTQTQKFLGIELD